jgi:hypothetical protein
VKYLLLLGALGALFYFASGQGILVGRDGSGPLELGLGGLGMQLKPGQTSVLQDRGRVKGGAVEFESARPALVSPGLEYLGPLSAEVSENGQCGGCPGPWPPKDAKPLTRIVDDQPVVSAVRVKAPGIYYLSDLRTRYRRGLRRFEEVDGTDVCAMVTADADAKFGCGDPRRVAGFSGLADIGGPSDYGDARFVDDPFEGTTAMYRHRQGGELSLSLTISNRSGKAKKVEKLGLGSPDPTFHDLLRPLPPEPRPPFTIPAHGSRSVRIHARFGDCKEFSFNTFKTYRVIEAGDDDVELSLPIAVRAPKNCP